MGFRVPNQAMFSAEALVAARNLADVWLLACVDSNMGSQVEVVVEGFVAVRTLVRSCGAISVHRVPAGRNIGCDSGLTSVAFFVCIASIPKVFCTCCAALGAREHGAC